MYKGDLRDFKRPKQPHENRLADISPPKTRFSRKKIENSPFWGFVYVRTVRIFKNDLDNSLELTTFASWQRR